MDGSALAIADASMDAALSTTATLEVPLARWLASQIAFAPGMDVLIGRLGPARDAVIAELVRGLELRHGEQSLSLGAVAFVGLGCKDGG